MNELAGRSLGGYYLESEIGRGSMGVVYRGKQVALGREVAIKVLPRSLARDASYIARFIREAQIIAGLNHPNIVQIYDAGQQDKQLYFVMEYVQGPTLASLLQLDGTITPHIAIEYAAQIAEALDAAYRERDVIHRDIKPENLMLNRWGKMKVMDFGLAKAPGLQKITVAKTLVGSIYYASPEQIWGEKIDNRSDVYALGIVLYEMVTGKRPFTGRSLPELTHAIITTSPQRPHQLNPEVAPALEQIIMKALSKDRYQRYEDAGSMAQHLRALYIREPAQTPPMPYDTDALRLAPSQFMPKDRLSIQPPKRPSAQRPDYFDADVHTPAPDPFPSLPLTPSLQKEMHLYNTPLDETPTSPLPIFLHVQKSASQTVDLHQENAVTAWSAQERRSPFNALFSWFEKFGK
ncbi:MAG TPA: protein kinase [Ktedonobacteraceae bacterium]|jgi:serine/threonine-protein kinase|nr:protein kinase [Ktedonobacteraceae bacterium]